MIPNPNYRKKRKHGIAAVFWIHLTSYIATVTLMINNTLHYTVIAKN
jgi:hypothetical protein